MLHHHTDAADPTSGAHWATGQGLDPHSDCRRPILAQISNARCDQVRIPMCSDAAGALAAGLRLAAGGVPGASLRVPVRHHSEAEAAQEGDGFGIYTLTSGDVRVDFHWRGRFTAVVLTVDQAHAFAADLDRRIQASAAGFDADERPAETPRNPGADA